MYLSIIIPVYNVERYLERCLDSLINQIRSNCDYEIICINDGSTDSSYNILSVYKEKYNNIVKLINIDNKGVSNARNLGIEAARGKYITFVDSDDWVSFNFVESIFKETKDDVDLVVFDSIYVDDKEVVHYESINDTIFNTENHACSKVFKRELIELYEIKFPTNISVGEDLTFTFSYISICSSYLKSDYAIYYYRQNREGSSMTSYISEKYKEVFTACDYLYEFVKKNNVLNKNNDGIEYLFIKNLIVRNTIKVVKNNFNLLTINYEIKNQYKFLERYFPNWTKNYLVINDADNYLSGKLGKRYIKVLYNLKTSFIKAIWEYILGKYI